MPLSDFPRTGKGAINCTVSTYYMQQHQRITVGHPDEVVLTKTLGVRLHDPKCQQRVRDCYT